MPVTGGPRVHPSAVCDTDAVGSGVEVHPFAAVAAESTLGDRCTIATGARVLAGVEIGPDVVVGENAVVGPRIAIGRGALIEPGAVVTDPVPANAIVRGNPARIVGYGGGDADRGPTARFTLSGASSGNKTSVRGVRAVELTRVDDLRGTLTAAEFADIPFVPVRLFTVSGVPGEHIRGAHAHRECEQVLVCVTGAVSCVVDDGHRREEVRLDTSGYGLYAPAMIWSTQYLYSPDATLLVLASRPYDPADYIRDYDEFLRLVETAGSGLAPVPK